MIRLNSEGQARAQPNQIRRSSVPIRKVLSASRHLINEERDERMPTNQATQDWKTQPAQGGAAMAVKNRRPTLSCTCGGEVFFDDVEGGNAEAIIKRRRSSVSRGGIRPD